MQVNDHIVVMSNGIVVHVDDATVTVSLDRTYPHLVTVNRDEGGPSETIPRVKQA